MSPLRHAPSLSDRAEMKQKMMKQEGGGDMKRGKEQLTSPCK
jgi:hypothetical protein